MRERVHTLGDEKWSIHSRVRQQLDHISHRHGVPVVVEILKRAFDATVAPAGRTIVFGCLARDGILSTRYAEVQVLCVRDGPDKQRQHMRK